MKTEDFIGTWRLNWSESGFFPNENLCFESTKDSLAEYMFRFKEDGIIVHEISDDIECPVGTFTMKEGTWTFKDNILTLELRGLKIADFWYWWKVEYKVEVKENHIMLNVNKVLKNKQIPPTKTWEDLIKQ